MSFFHRIKARRWKAVLVLVALAGLYAVYHNLLAPTRIALVNFPLYQITNIALASDSRLIDVEAVGADKASTLSHYDAILLFGPGLRLTDEQSREIERAGRKGTAVYTFVFTSGLVANHNVDSLQQKQLDIYYNNRCRENFRGMLHYIRKQFDRHKLFGPAVAAPKIIPSDVFFHLDESNYFESAEELTEHLRQKGIYHEGGPRIAFLSGLASPLEGNKGYIDSLISRLTDAGFNVYAFTSTGKRQALIEQIRPDAVVYLPMGRLGGDKTVSYLTEHNVPLFCPLTIMQSHEEWMSDSVKAVSGGYLSARVVLPELDGSMAPLTISTQNERENGYVLFDGESERLTNFTDHVSRYMALRRKPNAEKRIAICYFKGAGQSALVAAGLEVAPSLYELLKHLRQAGYNVDGLPHTFEAFNKMLQQQAPILGAYAKGAQADFMASDYPLWIKTSDYERWAGERLDPAKYQEVVERYGEAPGEYLSGTHDGESALAVACLRFGNVLLFPQPHAALSDDEFKIVHGANMAPPHAYIAPYLYAQAGFKADALIHFGTHGSLEFTPGKQVGLSRKDWADCLVGSLPHFYYYSIGNVGEGIIAKRRSHAALLSYLTPPFLESQTRGQFTELFAEIDRWYKLPEQSRARQGARLKQIVLQLGLHRDLRLDSIPTNPLSDKEIEQVENFAEEIANEKMTGALYTTGLSFTPAQIEQTVIAMSADPIAYSLARLDQLNGKITQEQLENTAFVARRYLTPVKVKLRQLLAEGKTDTKRLLQELAGITPADLMQARATDRLVNPRKSGTSDRIALAQADSAKAHQTTAKQARPSADSSKEEQLEALDQQRLESRRKAKRSGQKDILPEVPTADKERSFALLEIERTLSNLLQYKALLIASPKQELQAITHALNGGYIAPTPGGDVVLAPNTLPTGRNMYSINAEATPSVRAWDNAKQLVEHTLKNYQAKHGDYPRKVSYTFWAGEFIETEGATFAQALYMLGVEPIRDGMGRTTDLRLIPSKELGRPRIDIVVQTSGQLRDLAASRLALLTRAVEMATHAEADDYPNYVAQGSTETEQQLVEKGLSPQEARALSTTRVFGGVNGRYGTGIMQLVEKGDAWEDEREIADTYINNMSAIYGDPNRWGTTMKELFIAALAHTDIVVQPRQSNTWGALSLDHIYEFMGGINLSVRNVTGKEPETYLSDYRNRHRVRMQELKEAIGVESRTTLLNPAYIKEKMKGGASTAATFAKTFRNTYGWNVMKPEAIDNELWDALYNTYIADAQQLGIRSFFEQESPAALQEMTAVMLETARKGYWKATDEQLARVAALHTELVDHYKPACSEFVCDNEKLSAFIARHAATPSATAYQKAMQQVKETAVRTDPAVVMKRETLQDTANAQSRPWDSVLISLAVLFFFGAGITWILKRRKS